MLKKFKKDFPLIILASIISVVVIICCLLIEKFIISSTVVEIILQLAIGILVNSVFFYTQIYLVQKKKCEFANKCILKRINLIQHEMRDIFDRLIDLYFNSKEKEVPLDDAMFLKLLQRTVSSDYVRLIDPRKYGIKDPPQYTVSEFVISKVDSIEMEIDRLCSYYNQYVSPELMEVLELIIKSPMHINLARSLLLSATGARFECNTDIFYKSYFELISKLENMKKQYE